jgi:hypothetical protein
MSCHTVNSKFPTIESEMKNYKHVNLWPVAKTILSQGAKL